MSINKSVLNSNGDLTPFLNLLTTETEIAITKISSLLPIENLDLVICHCPEGASPSTGIGGNTYTSNYIAIYIDAKKINIANNISNDLLSVLAHEFHHAKRMECIKAFSTLAEVLILEGLACHFEKEVTSNKLPSLFRDMNLSKFNEYYQIMKPDFNSTTFDFEYLFLGKSSEILPRYAGYLLGYKIVDIYVKKYNIPASQLYDVSAELLIADLKL